MTAPRLILASGSTVRRRLLASAGVVFSVDPADIDEAPQEGEPLERRAGRLARDKALAMTARYPSDFIVGADQVGVTEAGVELSKCKTAEAALAQLMSMQGRAHTFTSAACLVRRGAVVWEGETQATVRFRPFEEAHARTYLHTAEWWGSAGSYQLEGRGAQLVAELSGHESTVLGLPFYPLLHALQVYAPHVLHGVQAVNI